MKLPQFKNLQPHPDYWMLRESMLDLLEELRNTFFTVFAQTRGDVGINAAMQRIFKAHRVSLVQQALRIC